MQSMPAIEKWLAQLRPAVKALLQPTSYLGLATIVLIWGALLFHLDFVWDKSEHAAIQATGNLARAFEEHIVRTVADIDRTIHILCAAYLRDPAGFDIDTLLTPGHLNNITLQIALIGPDGVVRKSTLGPQAIGVDLSDREHFQVFADSHYDQLFISKPVFGRVTQRWAIQLAREIRDTNGVFQGVMVASLDPYYLVRFYESIDLGEGGAVRLIGLDRVVRAQAGFKTDRTGQAITGSKLFGELPEEPAGSYVGSGVTTDGTERQFSYRVLNDYPLVVTVGLSLNEIFREYDENRWVFYGIAIALTVLILAFIGGSARRSAKLRRARDALDASEARAHEKSRELEITLDHMNQGLMMIDAQGRIAVVNDRAIDLLGLPPDVRLRPKYKDIIASRLAAGEYGNEGDGLRQDVRAMFKSGGLTADVPLFERTRPNGAVIEVRSEALPDGGVVRTFTEISQRKRYEAQISHMAHHDALTGLANRSLLKDRIKQAVGRLRRLKEGFAVLCLDLDRFKGVNDTYGHPAGDALLCVVADRLRQCVRETDTVARMGGDEFVVLQATSTRREDIAALAERIVRSLSAPYDIDGTEITIGVSVGIAVATDENANIEELLRTADIALYHAKSSKADKYRFFALGMVRSTMPSKRVVNS
jgi:diguanylate cyclase (GGDEF)-like protein